MPTGGEHPEVDIQNLGLPDKTKSVKNWNMSYNYRKNKSTAELRKKELDKDLSEKR